jgi:hypothetical protein
MSACTCELCFAQLKSAIHLNNLHEALKRNQAIADFSDAKLLLNLRTWQ